VHRDVINRKDKKKKFQITVSWIQIQIRNSNSREVVIGQLL